MAVIVIQDSKELVDRWAEYAENEGHQAEKIFAPLASGILIQLRAILSDRIEKGTPPFEGTLLDFLYRERTNAFEVFAALSDVEKAMLGTIILATNEQEDTVATLILHAGLNVKFCNTEQKSIVDAIRRHL